MFLSRAIINISSLRAMTTKVPKPPGSAVIDTGKKNQDEDAVRLKIDLASNYGGVGYKPDKKSNNVYLNPLLTPPPRAPSSPEDFRYPERLGHWFPIGFDYFDPLKDKYTFHEFVFYFITVGSVIFWMFCWGPDFKDREWARREAFLRTHKREALGLPLIDINVVDPERIVLPTEEELGDFPVTQ